MSEDRLVPFDPSHAAAVARWGATREDRELWMGEPDRVVDAACFAMWHAVEGCSAFVLVADGESAGYGELWDDEAAGEIELARLIVAPDRRGRGHGRRLVEGLVLEAKRRGERAIWLRVFPRNAAAQACYRRAGFERASPEVEAAFNVGQPRAYVWMWYGVRSFHAAF